MLNHLWLGMLVVAVLIGGFTGHLKETTDGAIDSAKTAVTLAIGLIGVMTLWLGIMRLAERSGLVSLLARALRPLLKRLFPDVPGDHPAMGSMVMNIAANMLGLNNAATPLGLRAMRDLETLNPHPGTATNAMCTFLAINTGSVQLISVSAIAILAAAGSKSPTAIVGTTLLATLVSSIAGVALVKVLERFSPLPLGRGRFETAAVAGPAEVVPPVVQEAPLSRLNLWRWLALFGFVAAFAWFFVALSFPDTLGRPASDAVDQATWIRSLNAVSLLAVPFMISFFPLYAWLRGLPVFEEFVEGAKDGFGVAVQIIPYFVAMLVAIGCLRGAGAIEMLTQWLTPALALVNFPPELAPMALIRPLSGSGSMAALSDLVRTLGPDHLITRMAATLFGSTETTFYVIAVYFGSVAVKRTRHAIWAGLGADLAGIIAAVIICRLVFG
jgi:spore maturation protein SpmA/spore maturation protein SpmB